MIHIEWKTGFLEIPYRLFMKMQTNDPECYTAILDLAAASGGWRLIE